MSRRDFFGRGRLFPFGKFPTIRRIEILHRLQFRRFLQIEEGADAAALSGSSVANTISIHGHILAQKPANRDGAHCGNRALDIDPGFLLEDIHQHSSESLLNLTAGYGIDGLPGVSGRSGQPNLCRDNHG